MKSILLFCTLCVSTVFMLDCTGKPDGIYEAGCKTFVTCTNGSAQTTECTGNQVYNLAMGKCDDHTNVAPPCGNLVNCTGIPNGKYPDYDQNCTSYHTCHNGLFFGHNFCAAGLVFNAVSGNCDWKRNVLIPCGTVPRP